MSNRTRRLIAALALSALVAGCAVDSESTVVGNVDNEPSEPAEPASQAPAAEGFDLALVQSNFADECADPIVFDELFCDQVDVDGLTADGTRLVVATTLNATGMEPRAAVICDQIATAHFDGATGEPLGFVRIAVLDRDGETDAECAIRE